MSDEGAEKNILSNSVIFIPGIVIMKPRKVRYLNHVESMGVKRSSFVILAEQIDCNVSPRRRSCK